MTTWLLVIFRTEKTRIVINGLKYFVIICCTSVFLSLQYLTSFSEIAVSQTRATREINGFLATDC